MARRRGKGKWLLLLLLVPLVLCAGLPGMARLAGWHWQGLGWQHGPTLEQVWWLVGDCRRMDAHGITLRALWPVRVNVQRLQLADCPDEDDTADLSLPPAPPFELAIRALHYRDYPALQLRADHHGAAWHLSAQRQGSQLLLAYEQDTGRWHASGVVEATQLHAAMVGRLQVRGDGVWQPGADDPQTRLHGRLTVRGAQLGAAQQGPRSDLTIEADWQGAAWQLQATLEEPLALQDWRLSGRGIRARGRGATIERADAGFVLTGADMQAELDLHSEAAELGRGQGHVTFGQGLEGRIDLHWADGAVTLQPFTVTGSAGWTASLTKPVAVPLTPQGKTSPALVLQYRDAAVRTTDSTIHWSPAGIFWRGALALDGTLQGYRLGGDWQGRIGTDGIRGEPLTVTLEDDALQLRARLPLTDVRAPRWPFSIELDGEFRGAPLAATLTGSRSQGQWGGSIQAQSRLPHVQRGGALDAHGHWQLRPDGVQLLAGAELAVARMLLDGVVLRPAQLTATTPIGIAADGIQGRLQVHAQGMVASRWELPPVRGALTLEGWRFDSTLQVPDWDATATVTGRDLAHAAHGTLLVEGPLNPAVSNGLDAVTTGGKLQLTGQWHGLVPAFNGRLQAFDVALVTSGGIEADGLQADLDIDWHDEQLHLHSRHPLHLDRLATGIALTDISADLHTDLHSWTLLDVEAAVLGGRLQAPELTWPAAEHQPVRLTAIDMDQLVSLQEEPIVHMTGRIGGIIPLRWQDDGISVRDGRLENETPLTLSINTTESVRALQEADPAAGSVLKYLSPLRIEDLQARVDMDADGWLDAEVTIKGDNRRFERPIVFNYSHQENVLDLLRSLRIGKRVTDALQQRIPGTASPAP